MHDIFFQILIKGRRLKFVGGFFYFILRLIGVDIPITVKIGQNVEFPHWSYGLVIHENTVIDDGVKIYQGVTLGRADIHLPFHLSQFRGIYVKRNAIICAGAKVLCKSGVLEIGENTIIGANSVLVCSTGDNEIWAGNPAKKIKNRDENTFSK